MHLVPKDIGPSGAGDFRLAGSECDLAAKPDTIDFYGLLVRSTAVRSLIDIDRAEVGIGPTPNATYFMVSRVVFVCSCCVVTFGTWLFSGGEGEPFAVNFVGWGGSVTYGPLH